MDRRRHGTGSVIFSSDARNQVSFRILATRHDIGDMLDTLPAKQTGCCGSLVVPYLLEADAELVVGQFFQLR